MYRIVLLTAALIVCASALAAERRPFKRTDETAINRLYARIAPAAERYENGLQALAEGQVTQGQAETAAAVAELQAAGSACATLKGCDVQRFFAAYDSLLTLRAAPAGEESFAALEDTGSLAGEGSPVVAHLPQAGRTVNLLKGRELKDIIALNGPVKASLTEWLTWMRPNLIDAYENYQYMRHLMWPEYERAGLPEALLFGILAKESGGKVHAVSRAGASGPLQFMPATGQRYGLGRVDGFDTRFDAAAATRANVQYLNDRFAELNNNLELALAAYNGGEGRMARLAARKQNPSFWDPQIYSQLPPETRDYVPMVLAAAWLFLHPEDYGLEFPKVDAEPSRIVLTRGSSINELTLCLGNAGTRNGWFRALRNLNPRYESHAPIAAGTELRVPAAALAAFQANCLTGPRAELAAELSAARKPVVQQVAAGGGSYVVKSGDSLAAIARRMQCGDVRKLAAANRIAAPKYLIRAGQKIQLAGCARAA